MVQNLCDYLLAATVYYLQMEQNNSFQGEKVSSLEMVLRNKIRKIRTRL